MQAEEIVSLRDQSVAASEGALPEVWMGETGGAFNSGCNGSTNAFMSAFWYANALGGFAQRGHDMFCRQTLTGGNYELINKVTNDPNPDFYAALLFGRLMGSTVLAPVNSREARDEGLAVYAHCLPLNAHTEELYALGAVTVLFLNYNAAERRIAAVNGVAPVPRHEFILTGVPKPPPFQAKDALHSDVVALNEVPLRAGAIFDTQQQLLQPRSVYDLADREVVLPPYSYGFIVLPAAASAACS